MFSYWKVTPLEVQTTHITLKVNKLIFNDLDNIRSKSHGFFVPFLSLCVLEVLHIAYLFDGNKDIVEIASVEETITSNMEAIVKLLTLRVYKKEIHQMFKIMTRSFWPSLAFGKQHEMETTQFLKSINMFSHFNTIFAYIAMAVLLSLPFIQGLKDFPVKIWFPMIDIHSHPYFELITIWEWMVNYWAVLTGVMSYDYIFVAFSLNLINQLKMLQTALKNIGILNDRRVLEFIESLLVHRLPKEEDRTEDDLLLLLEVCVKHHQMLVNFVSRIQDTYSYAFLAQCVGTFHALCFSGYILASQEIEDLTTTIFIASYILIHLVEMFILMGLAHLIYNQSLLVADAAFECGWYLSTYPKLRKHLVMIIHRSQKAQILNAAGLIKYDLEGYLAMCRWSFSFITLLQNVDSRKSH